MAIPGGQSQNRVPDLGFGIDHSRGPRCRSRQSLRIKTSFRRPWCTPPERNSSPTAAPSSTCTTIPSTSPPTCPRPTFLEPEFVGGVSRRRSIAAAIAAWRPLLPESSERLGYETWMRLAPTLDFGAPSASKIVGGASCAEKHNRRPHPLHFAAPGPDPGSSCSELPVPDQIRDDRKDPVTPAPETAPSGD